jgi:uroporphyrinogen-III synthase
MRVEGKPLHALITRPEADAEKLAAKLSTYGIACICEPMFHIHPILATKPEWTAIAEEPIQAIIATSANAVHVFAGQFTKRRSIPLYAVGDATAEAARGYDFLEVISAEGDVEDLKKLLLEECDPEGGKLVYVKGSVTIGNIEEALKRKKFDITSIVVYEAIPVDGFSIFARTALQEHTLDMVLFYSPRSAILFETLLEKYKLVEAAKHLHAFCMSKQVAESFKGLEWAKIHVAKAPNSESLLELIANFQQTTVDL